MQEAIEHRTYNVPVVDRNEVFAGEISVKRLIRLLLPVSLYQAVIADELGICHALESTCRTLCGDGLLNSLRLREFL